MRTIRAALASACLLLSLAAAASGLPAGVTRGPSVEGITEYRLDNGLKVLLFPDAAKPTITVNITYLVGSRHENHGETGMAHLLEHLLFKGTPKNPDIDKQFNQRGARSNGTTWLDRTNYYELFPAGDDNLRWAIALEADRMVNSFVRKSDLATEMTVVRNEYESGENSPFGVMLKRLQSVAFDWHAYGRSTIGNRSDIENVREENLRAFYRTYYQPDNAVLLVAGRFDEAKAIAWIAESFGPIPKPARTLPPLWTVEPAQDGEREFRIRRKGDVQLVAVAYKVPSGLHPDSDGVSFANHVLGDTPSGRLHRALVETGKAAQAFAFPLVGVDPGLHVFGAVVKKGSAPEPVAEEIARIVEGFATAPPSAQEMDRARKSYENQYEKILADHESVGVQLSEYIALGDWRLFFVSRDQLAKVTPAAVATVAGTYYRRDNRVTGFFLPEDAPQRAAIPAAPPLAEVMKDFRPKAAGALAEAFDPSQANIDARTRRLAFGGVKAALLAKRNRGETVNVSIQLGMGDEASLEGRRTAASLAGQMLSRGTTRFTRAALADEFERLKISGRIGSGGASFQTTRANLAEALALAAHVLREPAFPASEFEQLRAQSITAVEAQLAEPSARASEALARHFEAHAPSHWRYSPGLAEARERLRTATLEDARAFHRDFYGAGAAQVAIVGDFDADAVAKQLETLLAGWVAPRPYAHVPDRHKPGVAAASLAIETPDKENAVFLARVNLDLRDDDPDHAALYLADYLLGGEAGLDSRLARRLRQKDGLSYGAGSSLSVGSLDRAATWTMYAIAAPANMGRLEAAFREEIARFVADGVTAEELATAQAGALQQRLQNRAQDATLAGAWAGLLRLDRTFAFSAAFEARLAALTPQVVNAAIRRHLDPARLVVVKAGDFAKKSGK